MKNLKTIITFIGACMFLFSCGDNGGSSTNAVAPTSEQMTLTEGEVKIGTQIWAAKNLDVSTFRNGDTIPEAKTAEEWEKAGKDGKPAWCYYDNDPENGKKYGKLYNWYAVNDPRGLAPNGWHVPGVAEWITLTDYLGGIVVAGTKMKSTSGWNDYKGKTGNGTNESRFAGFPGGRSNRSGVFEYIGEYGAWWSPLENNADNAWSHVLGYSNDVVDGYDDPKSVGLSVRCVRD